MLPILSLILLFCIIPQICICQQAQFTSLVAWIQANDPLCMGKLMNTTQKQTNCTINLWICHTFQKAYLSVQTTNPNLPLYVVATIHIPQKCIANKQPFETMYISSAICNNPYNIETRCAIDTDGLHLSLTEQRKDNRGISQAFALTLFIISIVVLVSELLFIIWRIWKKKQVSVQERQRSALSQFISEQSGESRA